MSGTRQKLTQSIPLPRVDPQVKYQISNAFQLSLVPFTCSVLLMFLLFVFAKLNLFYLEANGLILDDQVRSAYYVQVEMELLGVIGFLALQVLVTAALSFVAMRWATAPFGSAYRMVELAIHSPNELKPLSRWLSESPKFDRVIWKFCQRVRGAEGEEERETDSLLMINFRFLVKFLFVAAMLSVATGYVTSIIFATVYRHMVDMALQLVQSNQSMPHYFMAQEEILGEAAFLFSVASFAAFTIMGIGVARYMANMIFVFSRAIQDDKFPLTLRGNDCYKDLSELLNQARTRIS